MERLKPCPFCGGEAEFKESFYGWMSIDEDGNEITGNNGVVFCRNCRIRTIETTEKDVIEAWNRRVNMWYFYKEVDFTSD